MNVVRLKVRVSTLKIWPGVEAALSDCLANCLSEGKVSRRFDVRLLRTETDERLNGGTSMANKTVYIVGTIGSLKSNSGTLTRRRPAAALV